MVPKPPIKEVNVTRMMIYSLIPFLNIYAGWRIQKFRLLLAINILVSLATFPLDFLAPYPYGTIISYPLVIFIPLYFVKKYAQEYNQKIKDGTFSY